MINYKSSATLLKSRRLRRLAIRPIVTDLHPQLYLNEFGNFYMVCNGLQVTLMELFRKTMEIFMMFYSKIVILKNGANTNIIRMLPIYAYPLLTLGLYLDPFSVTEFLVFNPMTSASASLRSMEISTTTHYISCKPILLIIYMCAIKMTGNEAETTASIKK